jgi:phage baseplate assembly protein W
MIPHFTFPFAFVADAEGNVTAAVNDQDTLEDVTACVTAILTTPLGFREELPDFGLRDMTFSQGGVDVDEIQVAIQQWEPRADVMIEEDPSKLQYFIDLVNITPGLINPITPQPSESDDS